MEVTKVGSIAEVEKQKLEKIKQEIEAVKNWSMNCKCSFCESEFNININDIARAYGGDEDEIGSYGCSCPVCKREYTFSASVLPLPSTGEYNYKKNRVEYHQSPGYLCLREIFHKNRVQRRVTVENGYPKRLDKFKRFYY